MKHLPHYPTLAPEDHYKAWLEAGIPKKMIDQYLDYLLEKAVNRRKTVEREHSEKG